MSAKRTKDFYDRYFDAFVSGQLEAVVACFHTPCLFSVGDTVLVADSSAVVSHLMGQAMQNFKDRGIAHSEVIKPVITEHQANLMSFTCEIARSKSDGTLVEKVSATYLIQSIGGTPKFVTFATCPA